MIEIDPHITEELVPLLYRYTDGELLSLPNYRVDTRGTVYRFRVPVSVNRYNMLLEVISVDIFNEMKHAKETIPYTRIPLKVFNEYNIGRLMKLDQLIRLFSMEHDNSYIEPLTEADHGGGQYYYACYDDNTVKHMLTKHRCVYTSFVGISKRQAAWHVKGDIGNLSLVKTKNISHRGPRMASIAHYDWRQYSQ